MTQTERMGPMLGGDIVVIEGRGYLADGSIGFNAFGMVSFDLRTQHYELRSYAQDMAGTFELKLTPDGYIWEIPAGPNAVIRFIATVKNNHRREVGEYVAMGTSCSSRRPTSSVSPGGCARRRRGGRARRARSSAG